MSDDILPAVKSRLPIYVHIMDRFVKRLRLTDADRELSNAMYWASDDRYYAFASDDLKPSIRLRGSAAQCAVLDDSQALDLPADILHRIKSFL